MRTAERKESMNIAFLLQPKSDTAFLYDDFTLRQGLEKMRHHGYTAIPVIDREGKYITTISEETFSGSSSATARKAICRKCPCRTWKRPRSRTSSIRIRIRRFPSPRRPTNWWKEAWSRTSFPWWTTGVPLSGSLPEEIFSKGLQNTRTECIIFKLFVTSAQ